MRRAVDGRVVLADRLGWRGGRVLLCCCCCCRRRRRRCSRGSSGHGDLLLLEEVLEHATYVPVLRPCILAGEGDGGLVQNLREGQARGGGVDLAFALVVGICFFTAAAVVVRGHDGRLEAAEHGSGEGERCARHDGRFRADKVAVVEGDLAYVRREVFDLLVVLVVGDDELHEDVDGWAADGPVDRVEHVHLHLREHACVVQPAAHVVELADLRHPLLLVAVLGGDEESRAPHELVMLLVHDALGAVAVEEVDGKEERLGEEVKCRVGFDDKVD